MNKKTSYKLARSFIKEFVLKLLVRHSIRCSGVIGFAIMACVDILWYRVILVFIDFEVRKHKHDKITKKRKAKLNKIFKDTTKENFLAKVQNYWVGKKNG